MADKTKIEWTEATWNPITGCSVTSPGCTNCYAMKLAGTRLRNHESRAGLTHESKAGPVWTGEVRFNEQWLDQPLRWGRPRMIFVCAHGDLFHESVPIEWIAKVFNTMADCPQHIFQVLTKRSDRMRQILNGPKDHKLWSPKLWHRSVLPNVWLGVSVEDQQRADERIPNLLATPAAIRWLSCEPLIGPVDLTVIPDGTGGLRFDALTGVYLPPADVDPPLPWPNHIDWIVAGGESGPGARPMHPDWARSLRDQCAAASVPFFFKQHGAWAASGKHNRETVLGGPEGASHPRYKTCWVSNEPKAGRTFMANVGKARAGRLLDGQLHDGVPEVAHG